MPPHLRCSKKNISRARVSLMLLLIALILATLILLPSASTSTSLNIEPTKGIQIKNSPSSSSGQCLDLGSNQGLDSLIANAKQILITNPAKAGGTTMHKFTEKCMNNTIAVNILSRQPLWKQFLIDSVQVQPLISSHLYKEDDFLYLLKSTYPRDTLIIHTHREEGTRLPSAIKEVARHHICGNSPYQEGQRNKMLHLDVRKNDTHCILDEEAFLKVIADKDIEIGISTHRLLTCRTYQAMEENAPQLVILNYKQIDKLNELLAKRYCPEMLDELPMNANAATDNPLKVLLHRNGTDVNSDTVDIDEWLRGKGPALEWTLKLREKASCQRKTLRMEDELFGCRDEALRVTPESVERW